MPLRTHLQRTGQIRLRAMLVLLAALPLFLAVGAVVWVIGEQANQLALTQIEAVKPILMQARKDEIEHFVQAGRKVLEYFCAREKAHPGSREEGRQLIRSMEFGKKADDNYFFIYTMDGTSVMHPRKPELEGKSLLNLQDQRGTYVIRALVGQARTGGGFVDYFWDRPSTNRNEPKLGYAEYVPECDWMIGTGLYMDHVRETEEIINAKTRLQVASTRDKILLIALAALLLVAAGGLLVNLKEQRSANAKLRAMAQKVVESQELERTRVARELHDDVSQSLASSKYIFESADIQLERGRLEQAASSMKEGISQLIATMIDVRRMSHDLYPTILDDAGLGPALEQLGREFGERTCIAVQVAIEKAPYIQRDAAKALFRIAQQALGNIEAHAQARNVRLALRHDKGITLKVGDDGVGFDVQAALTQRNGGLGLTNMRERIEMQGGSLDIQSQPGMTVIAAHLSKDSFTS
jgi:two-component system NarL family sensor kinase